MAYLLAVVGVRSIEELDARERASKLAATGNPRDGGSLVEQEAGVEELDTLLLDESHTQHLALLLIRNQLSRQHLPRHTRLGTLHVCHTCNGVVQSDIWFTCFMLFTCDVSENARQVHGLPDFLKPICSSCDDVNVTHAVVYFKTNKETDNQSLYFLVGHEVHHCMCDIHIITAAADELDNSEKAMHSGAFRKHRIQITIVLCMPPVKQHEMCLQCNVLA